MYRFKTSNWIFMDKFESWLAQNLPFLYATILSIWGGFVQYADLVFCLGENGLDIVSNYLSKNQYCFISENQ